MVGRIAALLLVAAGSIAGCSSSAPMATTVPAGSGAGAFGGLWGAATDEPSIAPTSTATIVSETPTPDNVSDSPVPLPTPESALPDGYQAITSTDSGYTLGVPSTWVYAISDGEVSVKDQVKALKAAHPKLSTLIDNQTAALGGMVKLVLFDPEAATIGRVMIGNLIVTVPMPSDDMKLVTSTLVSQISASYKLKASQITTNQLTLPAGPTVQLTYAITTSGVAINVTQYVELGAGHTYILTLGSTSGAFAAYKPIFAVVAGTVRGI